MNGYFALQFQKAEFYKTLLFAVILLAGCSSQTRKIGEALPAFVDNTQICKAGLTKILLINNDNHVTEIINSMDELQNELINNIDEPEFTKNFDKLKNKPCKNGFVSLPKIIEKISEIPQAKIAKETLRAEFSQRDKELVAMQKDVKNGYVSSDDAREIQEKFKEDFNKRRSEETLVLQRTIVAAVRTVAKNGQYDIVAMFTNKTDDNATEQMTALEDLTLNVIRQLSLPTSNGNKPMKNNPLRFSK